MMDENCIFCKIIKGDIPSNKVYEDDKMIAIHDVAPAAPVHVLLLPKEHTANVTTADPALVAYMLSKVKEIAEKTGIYEELFQYFVLKQFLFLYNRELQPTVAFLLYKK